MSVPSVVYALLMNGGALAFVVLMRLKLRQPDSCITTGAP
jgi:hypothetical protein